MTISLVARGDRPTDCPTSEKGGSRMFAKSSAELAQASHFVDSSSSIGFGKRLELEVLVKTEIRAG